MVSKYMPVFQLLQRKENNLKQNSYNWDEEGLPYSSRMGKYKTEVEYKFILKNITNYQLNSKILDIGGGSGRFSSKMKSLGYDCLVIDPDVDAISIAKQKGLKIENIEFHEFSSESKYAIILAIEVLLYIKDKDFFFNKVHQYLKNGGVFIFTATNP